mgnify:FL=1
MGFFRVAGTQCCGIKELADISFFSTPAEVIKGLVRSENVGWMNAPAFLFFSGVVGDREKVYPASYHTNRSDDYGQALADYITTEGLGEVTATGLARNYNGNMLRLWAWAPDWSKLRQLKQAQVATVDPRQIQTRPPVGQPPTAMDPGGSLTNVTTSVSTQVNPHHTDIPF